MKIKAFVEYSDDNSNSAVSCPQHNVRYRFSVVTNFFKFHFHLNQTLITTLQIICFSV